jgi:hypothetical protein
MEGGFWTKVMKKVTATTFDGAVTLSLSSRAKPRDLQFRGPFLETESRPRSKFVISTGA